MPVDDSATIVLQPSVAMEGGAAGQPPRSPLVAAATEALVRLDLSAWVGRRGRIYMVLRPEPGATVRASWTTSGVLLAGRIRSGEAGLVYAGPIAAPAIADRLQLLLEADGRRLEHEQALDFRFEIEIEP